MRRRWRPVKRTSAKVRIFLVLIIGGRRGSLDEETGKSITNVEYETARQAGVPCFVFINRSVNTLLSVWKKNPGCGFHPGRGLP